MSEAYRPCPTETCHNEIATRNGDDLCDECEERLAEERAMAQKERDSGSLKVDPTPINTSRPEEGASWAVEAHRKRLADSGKDSG